MARPLKEGLSYFSHDTDASSDMKLEKLLLLYGANGYALYFVLLEMIYRSNNLQVVSDAETIQILSRKLHISKKIIDNIINSAVNFDLFDKGIYQEYKILTSHGINERAKSVLDKRAKMADRYGLSKKEKIVSDAETPPETEQKLDKVKESKVKNSKEEELFSKEEEENNFKEKNSLESEIPENSIENKISDDGKKFAEWFYSLLPNGTDINETNIKQWAKTYDDLIRIDKREKTEIVKVCKWARNDDFWKTNFMSPNKLRSKDKTGIKYYDIFLNKLKNGATNGNNGTASKASYGTHSKKYIPKPDDDYSFKDGHF